jgi:hypothetical protein
MINLPKILQQPKLPYALPATAKWLSGEGAGSWFVIEVVENGMRHKITRYSPIGTIECEGLFSSEEKVDLSKGFKITYPSHCQKVTIIYLNRKASFIRL